MIVLLSLLAANIVSGSLSSLQWLPVQYGMSEPSCRVLHTATCIVNAQCSLLVHFGGFTFADAALTGSGQLLYSDETWLFLPTKQQWVSLPRVNLSRPYPAARGGHTAVIDSATTSVFIYGGTNDKSVFGDMWMLDSSAYCASLSNATFTVTSNLSWVALPSVGPAPPARWGHAAMFTNGLHAIFGGFASPLQNLTTSTPVPLVDATVWVGFIGNARVVWTPLSCTGPVARGGMQFTQWNSTSLVIISGAGLGPETLPDAWLLTVGPSACVWVALATQDTSPSSSNSYLSFYPYLFTAFGVAVRIPGSSVIIAYGGVRYPVTFFNNANLNAPANKFTITVEFNEANSSLMWSTSSQQSAQDGVGMIDNAWRQTYYPPPSGSLGLSMGTLGDAIVSFGGFSAFVTECLSTFAATPIVDGQISGFWQKVPTSATPANTVQASTVIVDSPTLLTDQGINASLYLLFGGQSDAVFGRYALLWVFRTDLNYWYAPQPDLTKNQLWPAPRWCHAALYSYLRKSMFVYGGQITRDGLGYSVASAELWELDVSSNVVQWYNHTLPHSPPARYYHTVVATRTPHEVFLFGGFDNNSIPFNDVWMLNMTDGLVWTNVTPATPGPSPRGGHVSTYLHDLPYTDGTTTECMVVFGGTDSLSNNPQPFGDMWCLRPVGPGVWAWWDLTSPALTSPTHPPHLMFAASTTFVFHLWLVNGGVSTYGNSSSDTWAFRAQSLQWDTIKASSRIPYLNGEPPALFNHNLVAYSSGLNALNISVVGGQTSNQLLSDFFFDYSLTLECPLGTYSTDIATGCIPCPKGQYSDEYGLTACTPCPNNILTEIVGSTSQLQCNRCADSSCNGNGDCTVLSGFVVNCVCSGWYQHDSSGDCSTPAVAIVVSVVLAATLLLTLFVFVYRRWHRRLHWMTGKEEALHSLLSIKSLEVQELENSWRISPSDVILQERIGVGTFGVVYAGLWRDLRVAIKASTHQIVWNSITHEISQIRTIRHPNIVLFFGAGNFENGTPFFVLELMEGGTLHELLHSDQDISWETNIRYAFEIASGMACVHKHQHIHRDLKSHNLLVSRTNHIKVSDFGTGRSIKANDEPAIAETESLFSDRYLTSLVGTVPWMAPEILSKQPYGPEVDVYSYAIVLWEIASRREPWDHIADEELRSTLCEMVGAGVRPTVDRAWPADYVKLMGACWDSCASARPAFASIVLLPLFIYQNIDGVGENARRGSTAHQPPLGLGASLGASLRRAAKTLSE